MSLPKNLLELPHAEFLTAVRKERKLHEKTMIDCRKKLAKYKARADADLKHHREFCAQYGIETKL